MRPDAVGRALELLRGAKELKSEDMEGGLSAVMLANRWRRSRGDGGGGGDARAGAGAA